MGKRSAHEMSVEQGDDTAGTADAGPDRHVFGPVGHQQAHGVALAHAVHPGPAGIAVGAVQQRAETQGLGLRQQRRRVAEPSRQFFDHNGKDARRVVGDRRRQFQRAQPCPRRRTGAGPLSRDGIGILRNDFCHGYRELIVISTYCACLLKMRSHASRIDRRPHPVPIVSLAQ